MGGEVTRKEAEQIITDAYNTENNVQVGKVVPLQGAQGMRIAGRVDGYKLKVQRLRQFRETEKVLSDGTSFTSELKKLLNRYSEENESNTPDFILANYMINCMDTFNAAVNARETWYGR